MEDTVQKIFATQSDEFRAKKRPYIIYKGGYLKVEHHHLVCKLVDTLQLYDQFMLSDRATYLRLLPTASKFVDPNIPITQSLVSNIVAIRPEFIPHLPNRYVDTAAYLKHIQAHGIHNYQKISRVHFRNKEFLLYVWALFPDLLRRDPYGRQFTAQLLMQFLRIYPICESSHESYYSMEVIKKMIKIDKLFTIKTECRRRYITREQVKTHYIRYISLFPQYIDNELLVLAHERHNEIYPHYAHLYQAV